MLCMPGSPCVKLFFACDHFDKLFPLLEEFVGFTETPVKGVRKAREVRKVRESM